VDSTTDCGTRGHRHLPPPEAGTRDFLLLALRLGAAVYLSDMSGPSYPAPHRRETLLDRLLAVFHIDFVPPPEQPAWWRVALATAVSLVGSLAADALLVVIGTRVFPSTKGYVHFQFRDYARLTVIGVVVACIAWPIVTRISSTPRWLFFRMAIVVTFVLFVPDFWILAHGAPGRAVAVLLCLHVAIALVTYNALVRIAPTGRGTRGVGH
jgi:hypothetical protein